MEETNPDWWTGRVNGRQALFPANYVKKLPLPTSASPSPAGNPAKPVYKPFKSSYAGSAVASPVVPPPVAPGPAGLQPVDQTEKKSKYGGLKNTVRARFDALTSHTNSIPL